MESRREIEEYILRNGLRERERKDKKSEERKFFQRFVELRPCSGVTDETREGKTDQEVGWK